MRILQLCNRVPYPLMDGGAIAMFAMTKSLADAGCEVVTLAINTKKHWVDESSLPSWFTEKTKLYTVFLKVAPFYRPNSIIGHTIMNI